MKNRDSRKQEVSYPAASCRLSHVHFCTVAIMACAFSPLAHFFWVQVLVLIFFVVVVKQIYTF